ncbi:ribosomal large subunit pseudouridine synthase B [Thorsellia anophelis DSM 18579]|uniref:Pseudouridine synthase n=1 Tax=Thorsellia anophelis DSM 18579 TaxID=1123402 RepID=A0A1I0EW06_9GAMM|nr:ribosomal large subunit pseudouridine synthase B [Thorsellia anophelis DSM 18579]
MSQQPTRNKPNTSRSHQSASNSRKDDPRRANSSRTRTGEDSKPAFQKGKEDAKRSGNNRLQTQARPIKKATTPTPKPATNHQQTQQSKPHPDSEKLQKVLARAGLGSRREVESIIEAGRVSVDGKIAHLGERVIITPELKIRVDGKVISIKEPDQEKCRILIYYKPEGEICTRHDPEGRPTVYERLPKISHGRWIAVGRLDINTSGLLLFTNDGELANRLMHPSNEIEREYSVRVFGEVTDEKKRLVTKGVQLEDGPASFKRLTPAGGEGINQWYNVVLTEGRNREVRRIWEAVELQVSRLIRIRYGNIHLPTRLPRGGWQEMTIPDVNYLRELVQLPKEAQGKINLDQDKKKLKTGQIRRAVQRHGKLTTVNPRRSRKV